MAHNNREIAVDDSYDADHAWDIHSAILTDDIDSLRQTLKLGNVANDKFGDDISIDHAGMTPLALACALNKLPAVKMLLAYGADVNMTFTDLNTTALMTSSFHGHSEIVRLLLKKGANAKAVDQQGSTALGYAFGGSKSVEVVNQLLNAGINVNHQNILGMNALLLVAGYGDDKLVKLILDAGADATTANNFGHTALHLAVVAKKSLLKKLLPDSTEVAAMYDLNRRDIDMALREWAHQHKDSLGAHSTINDEELDRVGKFMMMIGSRLEVPHGAVETEQESLKHRVEAVLRYRRDKMQLQRDRSKSGILDKILSCGSKRGSAARHQDDHAPLPPKPLPHSTVNGNTSTSADTRIAALVDSCTKILQLVIKAGCPINAMEKTFGLTALDMSILLGDIESTAALVTAGADSDHLVRMFASSELYDAIVAVERRRIKELLAYDVDLNVNQPFSKFSIRKETVSQDLGSPQPQDYNYEGLTPLAVAAQLTVVDVLDVIKLLQKHGADVNKVGPGGSSPLAEAARIGNLKMVQFLLHQGANMETNNPVYLNGTAVVVAVIHNRMNVVDYLIETGAKIDKLLSDRRSSLIKAMEANNRPMVERLLQADLSRNFVDKKSFLYQMAQEYQRLKPGSVDRILKTVSEKVQELARKEASEANANLNPSLESCLSTPVPVLTSTAIKPPTKPPQRANTDVTVATKPKRLRSRGKHNSDSRKTRGNQVSASVNLRKSALPSIDDTLDGNENTDDDDTSYQTSLKRWPAPSIEQQKELMGMVSSVASQASTQSQTFQEKKTHERSSRREEVVDENDGDADAEESESDDRNDVTLSDNAPVETLTCPEKAEVPVETVMPEYKDDGKAGQSEESNNDDARKMEEQSDDETESSDTVESDDSEKGGTSSNANTAKPKSPPISLTMDNYRYVSLLPSPLSPLGPPPPLPDSLPPPPPMSLPPDDSSDEESEESADSDDSTTAGDGVQGVNADDAVTQKQTCFLQKLDDSGSDGDCKTDGNNCELITQPAGSVPTMQKSMTTTTEI